MLRYAIAVLCVSASVVSASFFMAGSPDVARALKESGASAAPGDVKPHWPEQFVTSWSMFNTPNDTPFPPYTPVPAPPYSVGRGATYYDWSIQSMIEVYTDFCVPIFPSGNNWPCHFLNTGNISYLITPANSGSGFPPCCVFAEPWEPPAPDFLDNPAIAYNQTQNLYNQNSDWYVLPDPTNTAGPFGYGFYQDSANTGQRVPSTFYFRGVTGWTSQEFHSFQPIKPDPSVFAVPPQCNAAPNCGIMN